MARRTVTRALGPIATLLLALLAPAPSAVAITPVSCPGFTVLHNDRIGHAVLPSGTYAISLDAGSGLSCAAAAKLFGRFLEDYDGVLPRPWRVVSEGMGQASFRRGSKSGFAVARGSGGGGGPSPVGRPCPASFAVNAGATVGPLVFPRGRYLLYLPPRSGLSCRRAAVLFTRFLGAPGGRLPAPWRLQTQIATFFKLEHPQRSAFRVDPVFRGGPPPPEVLPD